MGSFSQISVKDRRAFGFFFNFFEICEIQHLS